MQTLAQIHEKERGSIPSSIQPGHNRIAFHLTQGTSKDTFKDTFQPNVSEP
jgi:hypothetical protein